jgi:hypothetical protein
MGRRATVSLARLSSSSTAYLYGRMTSTRRYGTTTITIPNMYRNTPLAFPAPRCACSAHLASASLRRLPFPQRVHRVHAHSRPPTAPTPRTVSIYAIVAVYHLSCLGPRHPVHGYGVLNPESGWGPDGSGGVGCYVCVQPLARRGGRRREKYGMGRGAMEAPARRSDAEPRRRALALGGRRGVPWGSGCGGSLCVSPGGGGRGVYMCVCGGAVARLLRPPTTLGFHHIAFSHLSTHS